MLENIYKMVCESKIVCGMEVWGLSEEWIELDKVHSRFYKKVMSMVMQPTDFLSWNFAETIGEASS
jgi:hypothetical protein